MPDIQISQRLLLFLSFLPILLISLSIHEFSHAFFANKFGDPTPKMQGRLTFNPIKHLDLFGSLIMPVLAFASGFMLIGWAKPVQVNTANLKNRFRDDAVISAAGPLSNLLLAVIVYLIMRMGIIEPDNFLTGILRLTVVFNVFLFCFNLLPIPPLDGSHILFDLFPNKYTAKLLNLGFYGTILLFFFIYSPLWGIFMNFVNWVIGFFPMI